MSSPGGLVDGAPPLCRKMNGEKLPLWPREQIEGSALPWQRF